MNFVLRTGFSLTSY